MTIPFMRAVPAGFACGWGRQEFDDAAAMQEVAEAFIDFAFAGIAGEQRFPRRRGFGFGDVFASTAC